MLLYLVLPHLIEGREVDVAHVAATPSERNCREMFAVGVGDVAGPVGKDMAAKVAADDVGVAPSRTGRRVVE